MVVEKVHSISMKRADLIKENEEWKEKNSLSLSMNQVKGRKIKGLRVKGSNRSSTEGRN